MRAALLALLLPACSAPDASEDVDATPPSIDAPIQDWERCDSPPGTAAISAAHDDDAQTYGRVYAGGVFTGGGDSGGPPGFALQPFFTDEALATAQAVIRCETGSPCGGGVRAEAAFLREDAIGVHDAVFRDAASTWEAAGTITITDLVYPLDDAGHVAGSIHVESSDPPVAIDGTFDHAFCAGLLEVVL